MPAGAEPDSATINLSGPAFWEAARASRLQGFERLRTSRWRGATAPIVWTRQDYSPPRGHWAVTRYEDVRTVHRDARTVLSGQVVMLYDNLLPDNQ